MIIPWVCPPLCCYFAWSIFAKNPDNHFSEGLSVFFSEISYSLYVIHLPLSLFLTAWIFTNPAAWSLHRFAVYSLLYLFVLGMTFVFWMAFESRYKDVRRVLKEKLVSF